MKQNIYENMFQSYENILAVEIIWWNEICVISH